MRRCRFFFCLLFCTSVFPIGLQAQTDSSAIVWNVDRLDTIGGFPATTLSNDTAELMSRLPTIIATRQGKAAQFNGRNEGVLVKGSPLTGQKTWTLEVILRPDSSSDPKNLEQRFLHIAPFTASRERLLFEIRLLKNQKWAFDLYLSSGTRSLILLDTTHEAMLHTASQWHHIAVVYENPKVTTYIDGVPELRDTVSFHAPLHARTSIGTRQDPRSWFKGAIRIIKATPRALVPEEFLKP